MGPSALEKVRALAEQVAVREGCQLYDVEFAGPSRTLRVYIDRQSGGASLDDCVNVSRGLNLLLDVEDVVPGGRYELEVSTPGVERKLTQPWHFEKAIGQRVRVRARKPDTGAMTVEGELVTANPEGIVVQTMKQDWPLAYADIERAQVVFVDSRPSKNKKR